MSLFLVYITARGELPQYLATVLGPYPMPEGGGASSGSTVGDIAGQVGQGLDLAKQAGGLIQKFGGAELFGGGGGDGGDYGGGGDY